VACYSDIRVKFIKPYYYRHPSVRKLIQLLSVRNEAKILKTFLVKDTMIEMYLYYLFIITLQYVHMLLIYVVFNRLYGLSNKEIELNKWPKFNNIFHGESL